MKLTIIGNNNIMSFYFIIKKNISFMFLNKNKLELSRFKF